MNGGETLEKKDDDGKPTTIVCDCGEKAVPTVFEVVTMATMAVFLVYVAFGVFGHFRAVNLERKEATLLKRQKTEQLARDKLILEIEIQRQLAETGGSTSRASTSVTLDTTFSWYEKWILKNG